jgi:hypothetical protein
VPSIPVARRGESCARAHPLLPGSTSTLLEPRHLRGWRSSTSADCRVWLTQSIRFIFRCLWDFDDSIAPGLSNKVSKSRACVCPLTPNPLLIQGVTRSARCLRSVCEERGDRYPAASPTRTQHESLTPPLPTGFLPTGFEPLPGHGQPTSLRPGPTPSSGPKRAGTPTDSPW